MATPRIYLDYNATSALRPEARDALMAAVTTCGNASSVHAEGRGARLVLETARREVADLAGARPEGVIFTSGGTEAANLALAPVRSSLGKAAWSRLLVGASEHAAVMKGHRFSPDRVDLIPVLPDGVIDLDRLRDKLKDGQASIVAIQAANNETGVVQPMREIAEMVHVAGGLVVCDAVQAAGRVACGPEALGADMVLLSAHKIGGAPGAGALVMRRDDLRIEPLIGGGGQERGLRAGSENVPAIAAFGAAARIAKRLEDAPRLASLRDRFETALRRTAPEVVIFSEHAARLPNTSAFAIPGIAAERMMMALDLGGVAVSSGSACSSGKVGRSHVLEAMGVPPDLRLGALRVSFGWRSLESDVDGIIAALASALERMMRRPLRSAA